MKIHVTMTFETDDGTRILLVFTRSIEVPCEDDFEALLAKLRNEYRKAEMADDDYRQLELDL